MNFTDIFIRRPVLASVISLLILVLGLRAVFDLPVRQFPVTENAQVTITTAYFGAAPDVMAGFITTPLEAAVAEAQGIDYITSSSVNGISTITAVLQLNYDANRALTEISAKVNSVIDKLPREAEQPVLNVQVGETINAMYIGFYSDVLPTNKITDYLVRVVQPRLQTIKGVQKVELLGARQFALRAWLDPKRLAAVGLTASDVYASLQSNNYISAIGSTKGQMVRVDLTAGTDLHTVEEFKKLVLKRNGGAVVRLEDVANVTLGAENYDFNVAFSGKKSVFAGIKVAPQANILEVIGAVKKVFPDIQAQLPSGLTGEIAYDGTEYVESSIDEVVKTLIEAVLIVTVVIFLFLGSLRSVLIPVVAIPLSLIGAFICMQLLGYSINLLTLLALVLAIGLVVDDAIIVVENVDRHMQMGKSPLQASFIAGRELAIPIIAISVVLIAVYVPIGFQGGLTGALFAEFAFTLAGAVAVSAVVALTLSPVMCAKFLRPPQNDGGLVEKLDHAFNRLAGSYGQRLHALLDRWPLVIVFSFLLLALIFVFYSMSQRELAPQEDVGVVLAITQGAPDATIDQMSLYSDQVYKIASDFPEFMNMFQLDGVAGVNSGIAGVLLKPWDQRERDATAVQQELQEKFNTIAGAKIFAFQFPPLPGSEGGLPIQFVINSTDSFENMQDVAQRIIDQAKTQGQFYVLDSNLKIDKPQATLTVDRDRAAQMGLSMRDIGSSLGAMLGGGYANYFNIDGRSYKVMPQVQQGQRLTLDQLGDYYLRAANGDMVPASTVVSFERKAIPQSINRFQQLNSVTISGVYGGSQGEALDILQRTAADILPQGYGIDYAGQSRQFVQESGSFVVILGFALVIIFLVLAAQFESFRDPLIVLISVPMSIFGAMVFIFLNVATLNIYTQVGLVTLLGLISKHGILIVQFANELRDQGMAKREAIQQAAEIRLRPILMTTAATVLGVLPLLLASGAGAVGRNHMGLVIAAGISIGTLFTLFVVPAMYLWLSAERKPALHPTGD